ncbi:MAG: ATP synthase F1 subunit epsilon [Pseudomonadota bacterium]
MPIQFDLVSPERRLASREADAVTVPGVEGDLTAMPGHAAFLTTLRPGFLQVTGGAEAEEFFVTGGFAEIAEAGISVLAERAMPRKDLTRAMLDDLAEEAEKALEGAGEETRTALALRLNDLRVLATQIG